MREGRFSLPWTGIWSLASYLLFGGLQRFKGPADSLVSGRLRLDGEQPDQLLRMHVCAAACDDEDG